MPNEIKIIVRAYNETGAGFKVAQQETDKFAQESADRYSKTFSERVKTTLTQQLRAPMEQVSQDVGERVGNTIGDRAGTRIVDRIRERLRNVTNRAGSGGLFDGGDGRGGRGGEGGRGGDGDNGRVRVDVDVDRQSLLQRFLGWGRSAGEKFTDGFSGAASSATQSFFSGDWISMVLKILGGTALVGVLAPVLGGLLNSALLAALGTGFIGLGIVAAFQDPRIMAAAKQLGGQLKVIFTNFGEFFRGPVANFLEKFRTDLMPQLIEFADRAGEILAPMANKLGDGLIGFLQNIMPGVLDGLKGAEPVINKLAEHLPQIGQALGDFFRELGKHGPAAAVFFDDFLDAVEWLIVFLARLIGVLTECYLVVRKFIMYGVAGFQILWAAIKEGVSAVKGFFGSLMNSAITVFDRILTAASASMGWIPGIGSKLIGARAQFTKFREDVNAEMGKIKNKTVTIRMQVVGLAAAQAAINVANILKGMAHGGIKGAADGGIKDGMTWVGEQGPELVKLPPGAQVHSNADSRRMVNAGQGGGETLVRLVADRTTERGLVDVLMRMLRAEVADSFGGDAQAALGHGKVRTA